MGSTQSTWGLTKAAHVCYISTTSLHFVIYLKNPGANMKFLVVATLFTLAVVVAATERRQFGICSEECSTNPKMAASMQCPAGSVCRSNGCGHTCQKDDQGQTGQVDLKQCRPVLCKMFCLNGWATGDDGCPICMCAPEVKVTAPAH